MLKYVLFFTLIIFSNCSNSEKQNVSAPTEIQDSTTYKTEGLNSLLNEFTTHGSYIYEFMNRDLNQYTNVAFYPDGNFRITAYEVKLNNELAPVISLDGSWVLSEDQRKIYGKYNQNGKSVDWEFITNYSQIKNSMGVTFSRINPNQKVSTESSQSKNYEGDCDRDIAMNELTTHLTGNGLEIVDGPYYAYDIASTEEDLCELAVTVAYINPKDSIRAVENCEFIIKKNGNKWYFEKGECTID